MHLRVLPHVERREVQAERAHAAQEPPDQEQAGMASAIGFEAAGDDREVVDQLLDSFVLARAMVVGGAQALGDLAEQHAVRHLVVARRRTRARGRHHRLVVLDALAQRLRDARRAALALAQLLGQALGLEEVAVDDQRMVARAALADRLGVHVRQAVHVAADPRAEMQHLRHLAARASSP